MNSSEKSLAASSHRSPSPLAGRPNPNSRTPENSSNARKSFSGNPFTRPSAIVANPRSFNPVTPANSPSDFGRRNPTGKEGLVLLRDYEQKENEKDLNLKPARARSPAVSKGTKNFMSPTISAASKFAASPRKKVLTERNESVRTSVSFSDGKSPFCSFNRLSVADDSDPKADMISTQKMNEDSSESTVTESGPREAGLVASSISEASKKDAFQSSQVSLNFQNPSESLSDTTTVESDCVNVEAGSKTNPLCSSLSSPSAILAPLDADPSLPPYDPKTNYLSPRPQFLHYKPNPRIEAYLNQEREVGLGEGRRLEDHFTSECFSDTENTEETKSEDSEKDFEDFVSSVEMIKEAQEILHLPESVSEPKSIATCHPNDASESKSNTTHLSKGAVEAKSLPKPRFFAKSKSISLFLILIIACLSISVTDSPVISYSTFKDQSFFKLHSPSDVAEFAKGNFDGLAQTFQLWPAGNLQLWSAYSMSYFSRLIYLLREINKLGPLHYSNLTAVEEDLAVHDYIAIDDNSDKGVDEMGEQNQLGTAGEVEVEMGPLEEQGHQMIEADEEIEEAPEGNGNPEFAVHSIQQDEVSEPDHPEAEQIKEERGVAVQTDNNLQNSLDPQNEPVLMLQAPNSEDSEAVELEGENDLHSWEKIEAIKEEVNPEFSKLDDASFGEGSETAAADPTLNGREDKYLNAGHMLGIFLLILTSIAATAIYLNQAKKSTTNAVTPISEPLTNKWVSPSIEHTYQERLSSQNWPTEVDMAGESCPSEMSSFQKSSSYSKRRLGEKDEALSNDRKPRRNYKRESLASSSEYSMGSPSYSYGSFTTYEKISSKHGEDETVTPVRRSSRIRNQVTSP